VAFKPFKVLKSLLIREENTNLAKQIEIIPGGTASTTTTIQSSQTTNKTLTLPDATDTLVGKATVDVLTNKSFDADGVGNSITNIENADIKSGAAIDVSKLANGSVSNSEFQQLDGLTSPAVGTTQAQTLTSKTIVVANNTITTAASGNLTSTELNAALSELQGNIDFNATASSIVNVPSGNLLATNVQAALNEIQTELDGIVVSAGANQALSNLASTAVNVSIVPNLDETINLGSITRRYDTVYTDMISYTDSFSTPSLSAKDRTLFDTAGGTALSFASTTELNVNNKKITALATPTVGADAANKTYVDSRTPNYFVQSTNPAPNFGTNSTSYVDVTNLSVAFTTTGRLLEIGLIGTSSFSLFRLIPQGLGSEPNLTGSIRIFNVTSNNTIYETSVGNTYPTSSITNAVRIPPSSIRQYVTLPAGPYTIKVQMAVNTANANILLDQVRLFVREL
jgi:hypothetical protein